MAAEKERPSQYRQSSRKGKKAWRKNIDISDIEKSIRQQQDEEITHGAKDLSSLRNEDLFQVDTVGDEVWKQKLIKRKQIKKNLKSSEILDSIKTNSKVAPLKHPKSQAAQDDEKKKKIQGVSKKELRKLMALAGRIEGESKLKNAVSRKGLVRAGTNDLWGAEEEVKVPSGIKLATKDSTAIPEELKKLSTTGWSIATVAPDTLKRAPMKVKDVEEIPHAGKSYNPSSKEWTELVNSEYQSEKAREEARLQMQAYRERIKHLMETLDNNEEEDSEDDEDEADENQEPQGNAEASSEIKLSLNKPSANKKKTKYQRNKQRRHQEKLSLQKELKQLKGQLRELERFEEIEKDVLEKQAAREAEKQTRVGKEKSNKKHKLGTKHSVIEGNLELKFSDELSDSLRKLRPEGNLLYDAAKKLQSSGKIETRIPVKKGRRYAPRITEKWTYKDLK